jgi:hypothetical protein
VVLGVVKLHDPPRHMRLEGGVVVAEIGQGVRRHGVSSIAA